MTAQQTHSAFMVAASVEGVEQARKILVNRGIPSVNSFAETNFLGKNSVNKFFSCKPIKVSTFMKICEGLKVEDWRELAQLEDVVIQSEQKAQASLEQIPAGTSEYSRRATMSNRSGEVVIEITFEGSIEAVNTDVRMLMELVMKNVAGDTIRITDVRSGSIKLTVQGVPRDIARLIDKIRSGELTDIESFPIENVKILSQDFLIDVAQQSNPEKWRLVDEIIQHPKALRQLRGVDLSDADLGGAKLNGADLGGADLGGADLGGADLSSVKDLISFKLPAGRELLELLKLLDRRDFREVLKLIKLLDRRDRLELLKLFDRLKRLKRLKRLELLELSELLESPELPELPDRPELPELPELLELLELPELLELSALLELSDPPELLELSANLRNANLTDTIVEGCNFGDGIGLDPSQKADLKRQGAIFNDTLGGFVSSIRTPSPTRR